MAEYPRLYYAPKYGWYEAGDEQKVIEFLKQHLGADIEVSAFLKANPQIDPDVDTLPAGTTVTIPGNPSAPTLTGRDKDQMTFLVGGIEIPMTSARIVRAMDTGTSGWAGTFPWTPGVSDVLDEATRAFGYTRAAAYIGNTLLVSGRVYTTEVQYDSSGRVKTLTGYSYTADVVDSMVGAGLQRDGETLEQLVPELVSPHGIKTEFYVSDTGGAFEKVTATETDTIFDFLAALTAERGFLLGDNPAGSLVIRQANPDQVPVGTLRESDLVVMEWKAKFEGRKRFNRYKAITQGATSATDMLEDLWAIKGTDAEPRQNIATDEFVPGGRFLTFRADNTTSSNIKNAAIWRKNKQLIASLTIQLPVRGWYTPSGILWREGQIVTVVSETLGVPSGRNFLIRQVEYVLEEKRTAMLYLVPPEAYTKKDITDIWALEQDS